MLNKYITKIEGHGSLEIDWKKNKAELRVHEGERLFEGMLVGRTLEETHWITPRICGVCPIAHNLASLRACEDGLGIKIGKTSFLLRELMACGQMTQSHTLHLFFLSLPDYLGIDRGTELAKKDPKSFQAALDIKKLSDNIATVVAGRNIHPVTTRVGGFHKFPTREQLEKLLEEVKKTKKSAKYALDLCLKIEFPELKVDLEFIIQEKDKILSSKENTACSNIGDYKKIISEEIKNYSTAKFGRYKGREIMVGALARQYFTQSRYRPLLDFKNPFHNNLAQAIEITLYREKAEETLIQLLRSDLDSSKLSRSDLVNLNSSSKGIGAIEAPRGGLYHEFHWDEKKLITYANIITPTVQNLTSIEKSADALLEQYKNTPRKKAEKLLEMLVRAYDPCITCSTH